MKVQFARYLIPTLLVSLGTGVAGAVRADAHAVLERSDPPAYRLLLTPPKKIVLHFSEPVDPRRTEIKVLDQEGRRVDPQIPELSPDRRQASLPVRFPGPGIYTIAWRTLSVVDQHIYEGFFTLTVGPLRPGSFSLRAGVPTGPSPWEVAARWLMFVGAAVLGGGFLLHRFLVPAALSARIAQTADTWISVLHHRWLIAAWIGAAAYLIGLGGETLSLAERAARAAGEPLSTSLALLAAGEPMRTSLVLKTTVPLALLAVLRYQRAPTAIPRPVISFVETGTAGGAQAFAELVLVALLPLGISLTSHAAASQSTLPVVADWLHLLSAATWVGGLIYFVIVLAPTLTHMDAQDRTGFLGRFTQRFSNLALTSVAVLIVTGSYAAWVNVPGLKVAATTAYGRTLAVKLALLIPLLGIAATNLLRMRPRLVEAATRVLVAAQAVGLHRRFFRLVRSEVVLASVVLLVAAALALLPTSRQVQALTPTGQPFVLRRQTEGLSAFLRIDPYHVGESAFELRLQGQQSTPRTDARVRFTFLPLLERLGTSVAEATPQGDGRFVVRGAYIATRGPWMVSVTVRRRGLEDVAFLYLAEPDWEGGTPISPPTNPQAFALLRQADEAMNRLRSLRQRQELADGRGGNVIVFSEFAAPNGLHWRVIGGAEGIVIGTKRFAREGGTWREDVFSEPFKFPRSRFAEQADSIVFGPREVIDGVQAQAVVFILKSAGANARYVVWVDETSKRIVREGMVALAHYMVARDYDFDGSVQIRNPLAP